MPSEGDKDLRGPAGCGTRSVLLWRRWIPLTKSRFVEMVRARLVRVGISHTGYSGHSFRIGAATTAAQAGIPDSAIQALGRWSSSDTFALHEKNWPDIQPH